MINDKQFVLGKEPYNESGWKNLFLSNGFVLSYQEKLKVWTNGAGNNVLIGNVWQVDPKRESPQEELKKLVMSGKITCEDVFEVEKSWSGRYLLIVNDWIYLDAAGSLGVFYSEKHVSSSINVLCGVENRDIVFPDIIGKFPDFVPGMTTCYDAVKRLLPSQIFNFVTQEVKPRPLLPDGVVAADSYEERIDLLEKYFIHSIKNLKECFPDQALCLALTGGRDSRAAMAMLEKSGVEYKTFTFWHEWMNKADINIPKMLSKKQKKDHLFVLRDKTKFSQQRYDDYRIHTAGMAIDEDWKYYSYYQYDEVFGYYGEVDSDIVILRSGIWEHTNDYYSTCCEDSFLDFEKIFYSITEDDFLKKLVYEWYDYVCNVPVNMEISIWNKVYWDLRGGCWMSSIEQSLDIMDHITSIQLCNCRLFLSILMGFDRQDRVAKKHEEFIVQRVCPSIGKIPYDYQYLAKVTMKTRIHRLLRSFYHRLMNTQK